MDFPTVSVIIPTYKGAHVLHEAIQSVLVQTYPHLEIIVVDDASPDETAKVVRNLTDPRVKYFLQEKNQGARAARKRGIHESTGEIIAFLDQDDLFHPQKLEFHVNYLQDHPEVGMTYNARFSMIDSIQNIRDIWRPPQRLTLMDVVKGFPLSPSDMVLRRSWAIQTDYYMEGSWGNSGGEIVLLGRLLFEGCSFGFVDRALNYRRFHSGRVFGNIADNCESELKCLDIIFTDPRCPEDVRAIRDVARIITYVYWGSRAYAQDKADLGREYYATAFQSNSTILTGAPSPFMSYLLEFVIEDENIDHEGLLKKIFSQLPEGMSSLAQEYDWAVFCGHITRAARLVMWDRAEAGKSSIQRLHQLSGAVDDAMLYRMSSLLVDYDVEFGVEAMRRILNRWAQYFDGILSVDNYRKLEAMCLLARAFRSYYGGQFSKVPRRMLRALAKKPAYIGAPGVLSILLRSIKRIVRQQL